MYYEKDPGKPHRGDLPILPESGLFKRRVLPVLGGHYRMLKALASALTTAIQGPPLQGALTLRIDFNRVVTITFDLPEGQRQRVRRVRLYGDLAEAILDSPSMIEGKLVADVDRGMTYLYVYADCVGKHLVGNSYVQLLRVVSLSRNDIP